MKLRNTLAGIGYLFAYGLSAVTGTYAQTIPKNISPKIQEKYVESIETKLLPDSDRTLYVVLQTHARKFNTMSKEEIEQSKLESINHQIPVYRICENLYEKGVQIMLNEGVYLNDQLDLNKPEINLEDNLDYKSFLVNIENGDDSTLRQVLQTYKKGAGSFIGITYKDLFSLGFEQPGIEKAHEKVNDAYSKFRAGSLSYGEFMQVVKSDEVKLDRSVHSVLSAITAGDQLHMKKVLNKDSMIIIGAKHRDDFDKIITIIETPQYQDVNFVFIKPKPQKQ